MLESRQLRFALLALPDSSLRFVRFGVFEVDLLSGELRKSGMKLKLGGQPFQILAILLEHPGEVVTREEFQKRLWPDTFVDVDHNLNTAINKIREVLGDSSENPRFVETLPRRGYRFIASVEDPISTPEQPQPQPRPQPTRLPRRAIFVSVAVLIAGGAAVYELRHRPVAPVQRALTRLTFDAGLQIGATWSPDGRFIAYSSDRGGKFEIWVQQIAGGDPVQITKGPGQNWQPEWSPDGKYIAYRSEDGEGGLFVIPALGGSGLERKVASFGFRPHWSPDGSQILFDAEFIPLFATNRFYLVGLEGEAPREVLADFYSRHGMTPDAAVWQPGGEQFTVWGAGPEEVTANCSCLPDSWKIPLAGAAEQRLEIGPAIRQALGRVAADGSAEFSIGSSTFAWAPSGNAVYYDQTFRSARNIWRMSINPPTFRATAIERMTAGPGPDAGAAVSPDGKRLAFTSESEQIRSLLFKFDANTGRISGDGQAITSPGMTSFEENLSRDGNKLAFAAVRAGKWEMREKSLVDGRETPVIYDDDRRIYPHWSPDGTRLAYTRINSHSGRSQIMQWSDQDRTERPLAAVPGKDPPLVFDWSSDGRLLLVGIPGIANNRGEIWTVPVADSAGSETGPRQTIASSDYDIFQSKFSPDQRWILFEAARSSSTGAESTLFVKSSSGGPWIQITDGKQWDDKPHWSPDGKTIYFLSRRGGFFNVWGIRFDSDRGKPNGKPFQVSRFEHPSQMIPQHIAPVALTLTQDRLVVTVAQVSGNIWMLDNVDR
jgi:Tol biopolymer transport system component/DNA-binding winged helix-turn-helix (wHTH) protein